jgi:hypothetical protein
MRAQDEATWVLKRPFSLHRYRPEDEAGLSFVSLPPLVAQVEFDRCDLPRVVARSSRPLIMPFRLSYRPALTLPALILTVAAVQTAGAAIVPGSSEIAGFHAAVLTVRIHLPPAGSRMRTPGGIEGSNAVPSSGESAANLTSSPVMGKRASLHRYIV